MSFERSGGSTRSFDISVLTNNDIGYTFSSIEKNEYQKLYDYFKNKKITVKAQGSGGKGGTLNFDEDDKVDHYLEGKNTVTFDQNYVHSFTLWLKKHARNYCKSKFTLMKMKKHGIFLRKKIL